MHLRKSKYGPGDEDGPGSGREENLMQNNNVPKLELCAGQAPTRRGANRPSLRQALATVDAAPNHEHRVGRQRIQSAETALPDLDLKENRGRLAARNDPPRTIGVTSANIGARLASRNPIANIRRRRFHTPPIKAINAQNIGEGLLPHVPFALDDNPIEDPSMSTAVGATSSSTLPARLDDETDEIEGTDSGKISLEAASPGKITPRPPAGAPPDVAPPSHRATMPARPSSVQENLIQNKTSHDGSSAHPVKTNLEHAITRRIDGPPSADEELSHSIQNMFVERSGMARSSGPLEPISRRKHVALEARSGPLKAHDNDAEHMPQPPPLREMHRLLRLEAPTNKNRPAARHRHRSSDFAQRSATLDTAFDIKRSSTPAQHGDDGRRTPTMRRDGATCSKKELPVIGTLSSISGLRRAVSAEESTWNGHGRTDPSIAFVNCE
ncbi:Hypothetical Protein FCC1311_084322 [Hondaea fermentalgiana]|uniref:Uncharacterized protein n=1 Tax=Hondaea fermentalgiana TaxID=2315210 RepID=A0A2R5GMU1_9STRA|nr:Hypothetical Protein FCC1311_084322 [Hondaea fermentalgiana]|eukprot:GBG32207.1 Hypothetical Protein FCC1311_084322 [Hondaea fermentalgiana]